MQKLPEVEKAKTLMQEATAWSVMKWLREKKNVRKTADEANAALDRLNEAIKKRWTNEMKTAYHALGASNGQARKAATTVDRELSLMVTKIKEADDEARRAKQDAEDTFNKAEKVMSTSLAREGCRKAIYSWELHESAIQKAESAIRGKA